MKRNLGIVIFVIIIALALAISYIAIDKSKIVEKTYKTDAVTIVQSQGLNIAGANKIEITDKEEIDKLEKLYSELKKQETNFYDLALINETKIILNDEVTISLNLENAALCTYTGLSSSEFTETPKELIEWINKALDNNDTEDSEERQIVKVVEYAFGTENVIKEVQVTDADYIKEIETIFDKLKIAPSRPMNLPFVQNIVITLDNDRVINFMEKYPNICSYQDVKENRAYVVASNELSEWINKVLDK